MLEFIVPIVLSLIFNSSPPLSDLHYFPDHETARSQRDFGKKHIDWLKYTASFPPWEETLASAWLDDANHCVLVWSLLEDATDWESFDTEERREKLRLMSRYLGMRFYHQHVMPPPVPVWYFRIVD